MIERKGSPVNPIGGWNRTAEPECAKKKPEGALTLRLAIPT